MRGFFNSLLGRAEARFGFVNNGNCSKQKDQRGMQNVSLLIRAAERHSWRKSRRMRKPGTICNQANDKAASETLEQILPISRPGLWAGATRGWSAGL
jgi:hypothetical protein